MGDPDIGLGLIIEFCFCLMLITIIEFIGYLMSITVSKYNMTILQNPEKKKTSGNFSSSISHFLVTVFNIKEFLYCYCSRWHLALTAHD